MPFGQGEVVVAQIDVPHDLIPLLRARGRKSSIEEGLDLEGENGVDATLGLLLCSLGVERL